MEIDGRQRRVDQSPKLEEKDVAEQTVQSREPKVDQGAKSEVPVPEVKDTRPGDTETTQSKEATPRPKRENQPKKKREERTFGSFEELGKFFDASSKSKTEGE